MDLLALTKVFLFSASFFYLFSVYRLIRCDVARTKVMIRDKKKAADPEHDNGEVTNDE